jgi:phosphoglycerate-specific signal transduction histidine kinase
MKKENSDIHLELVDIKPKYSTMHDEYSSFRREAEFQVKTLQDQIESAQQYETKYKDRWEKTQLEYDTLVAELDARALKIDYLEKKLEEKYHLENLLSQMKDDYEELRRDKHDL